MRFILIHIGILATLLFTSACVKVGQVFLEEDNLLHLAAVTNESEEAVSIAIQDTMIANFAVDGISNWWGASNLFLTKSNGNLVVDALSVGLEYDRFGYNFPRPVDFGTYSIIRVKARTEGNSVPLLRIDLKDIQGMSTNHLDAKAHILACDKSSYYYFNYKGRFEQGWPFRGAVNKNKIAQMEFFVNPGGLPYTGNLFIEEIVMLKDLEEGDSKSDNCVVDINENFESGEKYWWVNNDRYSMSFSDNQKDLRIKSSGAGENYESFGRIFSPTDLTVQNLIKVTAKASGTSSPNLRVDLVDADGYATNGSAIVKSIPNDNTYRDYYFDFEGKLYQGWPQTKSLNSKKITEFMFFLNPGSAGFWGDVYISSVELVKKTTAGLELSNPNLAVSTIDLFSSEEQKKTWWASGDLKIEREGASVLIQSKKNSALLGSFGFGFDNVDFRSKSKFTIATTATGNGLLGLTLVFIDTKGISSMPVSIAEKLENGAIVFNIDKMYKGNLSEISGVSFYFEKGDNPFNGKILINNISVQ